MNQDGDLSLAQAHDRGGFLVVYAIDDLHFEEMVARPQRPALIRAPCDRPIADASGIGPGQPAAGLCECQVAIGSVAEVDHIRRTLFHQLDQLGLVEDIPPALADAGRNIVKELIDQRPDPVLDVIPRQVGTEQPDAAIDVVADAARRDDTPLLRVGRRHAANAKAIAPVNIGHGQACLLNARQGRHVDYLLGPLVLLDLLDERIVGKDEPIDAHVLRGSSWESSTGTAPPSPAARYRLPCWPSSSPVRMSGSCLFRFTAS